MDHLGYFCLVLLCFHAHLFIYALWSPAGKGLTSWLFFYLYTLFSPSSGVQRVGEGHPSACRTDYSKGIFVCLIVSLAHPFLCTFNAISWLLFVMSNCDVATFPFVSWVRCGT